MIEVEHTINKTGGDSLAVVLPKSWCKFKDLKSGDKVSIIGNGILIILPPGTSDEEKAKVKKILEG